MIEMWHKGKREINGQQQVVVIQKYRDILRGQSWKAGLAKAQQPNYCVQGKLDELVSPREIFM